MLVGAHDRGIHAHVPSNKAGVIGQRLQPGLTTPSPSTTDRVEPPRSDIVWPEQSCAAVSGALETAVCGAGASLARLRESIRLGEEEATEGLETDPRAVQSAHDAMHGAPIPDRGGVDAGSGSQP